MFFKLYTMLIDNLVVPKIRPYVNLGIGIGIGTDTTNAIVSTPARPVGTKTSRMVIQDEETTPTKSRDTPMLWSRDKYKTLYLHFHKAYGP